MTPSPKCPRCYGRFDAQTAAYTEAGLVCVICVHESRAIDAAQQKGNENPPWWVVLLNAIGIAGLFGTGVGFTTHEGTSEAELEARREAEKVAAARRRSALFLRRDGNEVGPFNREEIVAFERDGHLRPTDEFFIEGMDGWRPVSAFDPSLLGDGPGG